MDIFGDQPLLVRYRFIVAFLPKDLKSLFPPDIRFQKVSGLNATFETQDMHQGGDNNSMQLPTKTTYGHLVLERGRTISNINLSVEISNIFSAYNFTPIDILITAMNIAGGIVSAWVIKDAYPVRWSVSDLDANSNEVIMDTLELAYKNLKSITI